jgi:CRP-like cAMP-binding protein
VRDQDARVRRPLVQNRLLRVLSENELLKIEARAEYVPLKRRQVLQHWRLPMEHVYFLTRGLVSVSAKVAENDFVEAWLVGSEGVVGGFFLLTGVARAPAHRRVVQVEGSAFRIPVAAFLELSDQLPGFRTILHRYLAVLMIQTSQSGVCNAAHSLKQRLARWLLVACYALNDHNVPLTHEVLSDLLGVRRASVTDCLAVLEREAMIKVDRGCIRITDAEFLKSTSCVCFELIRREYDRQIGN